MVCPCCAEQCSGCEDCQISEQLLEDLRGPAGVAADGVRRTGSISDPPANVQYADGYPERLDGCEWFWWYATNACDCAISEIQAPVYVYSSTVREQWTLYKCHNGELVDITETATENGPFTALADSQNGGSTGVQSVATGNIPCPEPPSSVFLAPTIDCNEFP